MTPAEIMSAIRAGFSAPGVTPVERIDDHEWRHWHHVGEELWDDVASQVRDGVRGILVEMPFEVPAPDGHCACASCEASRGR